MAARAKKPPPKNLKSSSPAKISTLCDHNFSRMVRLMRFFAGACGFDVFAPGYRLGPLTMWMFVLCALVWPMLIYTMITRNRVVMMRASTLFGVTGQAGLKCLLFYHYRQKSVNVFHYLRTLYQRNGDKTNGNADILLRWSRLFWTICRMVATIELLCVPVFCSYPLMAVGTFFNENETVMPIFFPLIDEKTRSGKSVLLVVHMMYLTYGTLGILGGDLIFWIALMHFCPMAEMLINMLHHMDAEVQRVDRCSVTTAERKLHMFLDNIVEIQNEILGYMETCSKMFEINNLTEVGSNAMSLCLILYVSHFIDWFPLYVMILVVLLKLFVICLLGTIVDRFYEKIISAIEQFHWYLMSARLQRKFLLVMLRAQKPTCLIAGTSVVNLNLGVSIMKTVYSVAMLLNNMDLN